jgi:hypothetical protein
LLSNLGLSVLRCSDFALFRYCFDYALKGRGFSRAVSIAKSTPALAAEGAVLGASWFSGDVRAAAMRPFFFVIAQGISD